MDSGSGRLYGAARSIRFEPGAAACLTRAGLVGMPIVPGAAMAQPRSTMRPVWTS